MHLNLFFIFIVLWRITFGCTCKLTIDAKIFIFNRGCALENINNIIENENCRATRIYLQNLKGGRMDRQTDKQKNCIYKQFSIMFLSVKSMPLSDVGVYWRWQWPVLVFV